MFSSRPHTILTTDIPTFSKWHWSNDDQMPFVTPPVALQGFELAT